MLQTRFLEQKDLRFPVLRWTKGLFLSSKYRWSSFPAAPSLNPSLKRIHQVFPHVISRHVCDGARNMA